MGYPLQEMIVEGPITSRPSMANSFPVFPSGNCSLLWRVHRPPTNAGLKKIGRAHSFGQFKKHALLKHALRAHAFPSPD